MLNRFGITDEDWQQTPDSVQIAFSTLQHQLLLLEIRSQVYERQLTNLRQPVAQIDDLKAELAELRERLGQNSNNSSKPPSTDPPHSPQKNSNEAKGQRRGKQRGHKGFGRKLKSIHQVDHIVDLRPTSCKKCNHILLGEDPDPARHQVSEVPRCKIEVTEYRRHTLHCPVCGAANQASWPEHMPASSFGPRAQAIIAYHTGRLGNSHRDVKEVMAVLYGLEVSLGSVSLIQQRVSQFLAGPFDRAQQFAQQQKAQYVDETSWPEAQKPKWLWINATGEVTVFRLLEGRGTEQAKQVIDQSAKAIITTDRYGAYNWLSLRRRQICWAHLKRDFQAMFDRGGESEEVWGGLIEQVSEIFKLWHQVRDAEVSRAEFQSAMKPIQRRVKQLLEAGARSTHKKTRHSCQNMMKLEKALWTLVQVEGVEPTNNNAERALRRAVMCRKKSFGTQSESGSCFVERILSVVTSLRQQGRDALEYLTRVCNGQPCCLLPIQPDDTLYCSPTD
jgi:transposase